MANQGKARNGLDSLANLGGLDELANLGKAGNACAFLGPLA